MVGFHVALKYVWGNYIRKAHAPFKQNETIQKDPVCKQDQLCVQCKLTAIQFNPAQVVTILYYLDFLTSLKTFTNITVMQSEEIYQF